MSEQEIIKSKKGRTIITVGAITVLVVLLFVFNPTLRSIFQPELPEQGVGYFTVEFYDPITDKYYDGKYDLVTFNNTDEFYKQGVESGSVVYVSEPCLAIFNGSSLTETLSYEFYPISIGCEAGVNEDEAVENIFYLKRRASTDEVDMKIIKLDNVYGEYDSADISDNEPLVILPSITLTNETKFVGCLTWLPSMYLSSDSITLELPGWGLWIAFIGTEPPIEDNTVFIVNGYNNTIRNFETASIIQIPVDHTLEYNFEITIPKIGTVSQIILYDGEPVDFNDVTHQLAVIS